MANLDRFLEAQSPVYDQVIQELSTGRKRGHWMWFIFPQLDGLGRSITSQLYAIHGKSEATEYLAHATLGSRLVECTNLVLRFSHLPMEVMFGPVDALKLKSSMTLFRTPANAPRVFQTVLDQCFNGEICKFTLNALRKG